MEKKKILGEIVATYEKHGWKLRKVLMRSETRKQVGFDEVNGVAVEDAQIDALWFTRPSFRGREAWEMRLLAETPYALFETFAPDEPEEKQEKIRREMEHGLFENFFAKPKGRSQASK